MLATNDPVSAKFYIGKEFGAMVGKTIQQVRPCAPEIAEDFGWHGLAVEIVFTDGSSALITCDPEGNGPGWMLTAGM